MKKIVCVLLTIAMVCSLVPRQALAQMENELEALGETDLVLVTDDEVTEDSATVTAPIESSSTEQPEPSDVDVVIQGDITGGSFVDEESGATWSVKLRADGEGLALTNVNLAEGEGMLDITIPSGPVTFTAWNGEQVTGTIVGVSSDLYGWGGSDAACERVRSVTIPNTILFIDSCLFNWSRAAQLPNLETVTFEPAGDDAEHAGVTSLPRTFFFNSTISSVTLPTKLESIGEYAFEGCHNLTSVEIPPSVKSIEKGGFYNCGGLTQVTFHEGLETIGERAFYGSQGWAKRAKLTELTFPNSLESIEYEAFKEAYNLASVSFGTSLTESQLQTIGTSAFEESRLEEVRIPDSVQSIGDFAFKNCYIEKDNGSKEYTLKTVQLGSSQEASNLQSIGRSAFFRSQITTIALPNKLTYMGYDPDPANWSGRDDNRWNDGSSSRSAFYASDKLATIVWPTQPPQDGLGLTHVGGFDHCPKLSPSVTGNLPPWIDTIDYAGFRYAFRDSGVTSLTIPSTITRIETEAFAGTVDAVWNNSPYITSITFAGGTVPLYIGNQAFDASGLLGGSVVLPERVWSLGARAFNYDSYTLRNKTIAYYLYNKDIQIADETNPFPGNTIVYYPSDTAEDSDIFKLRDWRLSVPWQGYESYVYLPFEVDPPLSITGTVPAGATVSLQIDGTTSTAELVDGTSLLASAANNSLVTVIVSLEGYADYMARPEGGRITSDWSFEVSTDSMTPLSTTGALAVTVAKHTKDTERDNILAAIGCNVVVFSEAGKLVAQGTTPTSAMFIANDLPTGDYTVVAFDKNEYFSTISGTDDFARMGVQEGSWAQLAVSIDAGKTTKLELDVPDLQVLDATEILQSGEVVVTEAHIVPECNFYARVSYQMREVTAANKLVVAIPEGMVPVSAATLRRNYGIAGYDSTAHTLTINLQEDDGQSATVYVGLRAETPGSYGISASVASGAAMAPLGSAGVSAPALVLEVPQDELVSTSFNVDVYAAPSSKVYFAINGSELTTTLGNGSEDPVPLTVTTNKIGHATATLTIPQEALGSFSLYSVEAQARDEHGSITAQAARPVTYYYNPMGDDDVREWELSFVHATEKSYVVKDGAEIPNMRYNVVTLYHSDITGTDKQKTWPFTSVLDSKRTLGNSAKLMLKMLDGSIRYENMTCIKRETLDDGATRYTYMASVPIGEPNQDLRAKDIPCGLEVTPSYADENDVFLPPQITQSNVNAFKATFKTPQQTMQDWGVEPYAATADTSFWDGIDTQDLSQEELDQILSEIDLLDILIHERYKHQNWKRE